MAQISKEVLIHNWTREVSITDGSKILDPGTNKSASNFDEPFTFYTVNNISVIREGSFDQNITEDNLLHRASSALPRRWSTAGVDTMHLLHLHVYPLPFESVEFEPFLHNLILTYRLMIIANGILGWCVDFFRLRTWNEWKRSEAEWVFFILSLRSYMPRRNLQWSL